MSTSAASAAEWLVLAGNAGLEGRAQLPMHAIAPNATESWPRTTGSLLLAWTEARVDAEAKKQGLVEVARDAPDVIATRAQLLLEDKQPLWPSDFVRTPVGVFHVEAWRRMVPVAAPELREKLMQVGPVEP